MYEWSDPQGGPRCFFIGCKEMPEFSLWFPKTEAPRLYCDAHTQRLLADERIAVDAYTRINPS